MRYGFTTGSCAAAAAKAAAYMLLLGRKKTEITIETPKGIPYTAQILDIRRTEDVVSCAVQKDGGRRSGCNNRSMDLCKSDFIAEMTEKIFVPKQIFNPEKIFNP